MPVEVSQTPWHYTTFWEALDHWQTLAAGLIAILAAVAAVGGSEFFAHRRAREEVEAIRVSLVVEVQQLMGTMIETHAILLQVLTKVEEAATRGVGFIPSAEVDRAKAAAFAARSIGRRLGELRKPVVYPACADKIGVLGPRLAEGIVGFYGNYEHLQFLGRVVFDDPNETPTAPELAKYVIKFEEVCTYALPLFEELPIKGMMEPFDLVDLKIKVEGMAKARSAIGNAPRDG